MQKIRKEIGNNCKFTRTDKNNKKAKFRSLQLRPLPYALSPTPNRISYPIAVLIRKVAAKAIMAYSSGKTARIIVLPKTL